MWKTESSAGAESRYIAQTETKTASFVPNSPSKPAAPSKGNRSPKAPRPVKYVPRPTSYQIRNLEPSTAAEEENRKPEHFPQKNPETPLTPAPTPTPSPAPAFRLRETAPAVAAAAVDAPTSIPSPSRTPTPPPIPPPGVTRPPTEKLGDPPGAQLFWQQAYVPASENVQYIGSPRVNQYAHQPRDSAVGMTPIPEEQGDQMDELKTDLQAVLSKIDVIQRESQQSPVLAEKEEEIETLRTYMVSLQHRHKGAKELLMHRELQILQLEGQLAGERSSSAYYRNELASYEDEKAAFSERSRVDRQRVAKLEEQKRQLNDLLQESERSNTLMYDELASSEAENESLTKKLCEANTVINRLRDEKSEDAFFIQATQKWLAESEARSSALQKNAEMPQPDDKKVSDIEEKVQKERDQWADIFDKQRIQISQFHDKVFEMQGQIDQFESAKAKHAEMESENQMLRARAVFLQFQRVTLSRRKTALECELATAQKAASDACDRFAVLQKAYERAEKMLRATQASKNKEQSSK